MILKLNNLLVEVTQKEIKHLHLSVYPPTGHIKVSAPMSMAIQTIRVFVISKLGWIKRQQKKLNEQERETPREYINRESHYFNGKRYLLYIVERDTTPKVILQHAKIILQIRPNSNKNKRQQILENWYRNHIKEKTTPLISKWEKRLNVSVTNFTVYKMKTKWGSCTPEKYTIRLNLELAKKPLEHLEYIIVHELMHLIEPSHNNNFIALMDKFMPKWKFYRDELNTLPLRY